MTRANQLQAGAEGRAAIVAAITSAGRPLKYSELIQSPMVAKLNRSKAAWWQLLKDMTLSGLILRLGKRPFDYSLPSMPSPARDVVSGTVENTPERRSKAARTPVLAQPTIKVDVNRNDGRLRIEVSGNLVLDLGIK